MNEAQDSRRQQLADASAQLGLLLDTATADRLIAYLNLLQRWNSTYNLTAVRDPAEMLTQHLFDCLAVIDPLRRVSPKGRLLDVGSGGGLPGVVIAATCPDWQVVCVDTVGKKAAFIQQAAVELGLRNLRSEHARVENLKLPPFDVVTSRAFSSLPDFVRLTRKHLAPTGVWMAMKGKTPDDELAALPSDVDVFHVEQLIVPHLAADRCIVWMRPQAQPPKEP
ncbi:16S rRNA (guanine(527)-N(7))-methyltransferase RsmG [Piscinibacter terrae]|uniref:Ribosomal RNA small subunit methyltransferase G n=1 Tax=Piscinibacter terrae TaxID=2496871 RepID=A0A3N7HQ31_9BURK|nr:16S rRNA (guanine(527)-N(7))-methyltransferase RsmG [Albitalea terrae]RQP24284.1 16S rRNA (guanine(527)-N(7))-methyltransferase RsmG [Albitalea terrae]